MKEDALAVFRRRKIGFIFQAFNLVSSVNVCENIVLPLGLDGRDVYKRQDVCYELIRAMQLVGINVITRTEVEECFAVIDEMCIRDRNKEEKIA